MLTGLIARAPQFADGYVALADVERWDNHPEVSLAVANAGLGKVPQQADLLQARARALAALAAASGTPRSAPAPARP